MNGNLRMYRDFKQRGTKNISRKMLVSRPKFKEQIPSCSGRKLISAKKKKKFLSLDLVKHKMPSRLLI